MDNIYFSIFGFLMCSGIIVYSGTKLSFYGNSIAEITGMGKAWAGLILMASVTTLPELLTGISAVAIVKEPDLAAGNVFGSCVFNLMLLSILDSRLKKPLFNVVKSSHIVAAIFSIILLTIAGMSIFLESEAPSVLWISSYTFLIFTVYVITVWGVFKYEADAIVTIANDAVTAPEEFSTPETNLNKIIGGYALHAFIVIGAAIFLPYFGDHVASYTGLGNSFFGTLFMAAATSLPELVVSLAALRMGATDMAVGNLLGSNVFNIFILGVDDVFYTEGSIFRDISSSHLLSVFVTIIMTAVVGLGLLFKPKKKQVWLFSLDTFILIVLYIALISYLFFNK